MKESKGVNKRLFKGETRKRENNHSRVKNFQFQMIMIKAISILYKKVGDKKDLMHLLKTYKILLDFTTIN